MLISKKVVRVRKDTIDETAHLERNALTITVRHSEPDDCEALHRIFAEPQIVYWTFEIPFTPIGQMRQQVNDIPEGHYTLVACAGDEVIGTLGLTVHAMPRLRHVARIGPVAVCSAWQGKGVGSRLMSAVLELADNWLNILRLELFVYTDNASAIALYTKFGFVVEGTLRSMAFRAGQYVDLHIMARIRGESATRE